VTGFPDVNQPPDKKESLESIVEVVSAFAGG